MYQTNRSILIVHILIEILTRCLRYSSRHSFCHGHGIISSRRYLAIDVPRYQVWNLSSRNVPFRVLAKCAAKSTRRGNASRCGAVIANVWYLITICPAHVLAAKPLDILSDGISRSLSFSPSLFLTLSISLSSETKYNSSIILQCFANAKSFELWAST